MSQVAVAGREVVLPSSPMVNAPNVIAWAKSGYSHKSDRKTLRSVLTSGWDLTDEEAGLILSGRAMIKIEGSDVVVTFHEE